MRPGPGGRPSAGASAPADIAATRRALRETSDDDERRQLEDQLEALQRSVLGGELGRLSGALTLSEERRITAERTLAAVAKDAAAKVISAQSERDEACSEAVTLRRELQKRESMLAMAQAAVESGTAERTDAENVQFVPRGRAWRALLIVAVLIGILVAIDGVLTIVWQEPLSSLFAAHAQHKLNGQFATLAKINAPTVAEKKAITHGSKTSKVHALVAYRTKKAAYLLNHAHPGTALAKISIPKIDAHFTVIEGTSTADLQEGPGHYRGTMLPGLPGTTAIAGHRTTFKAPFRDLNKLKPGSKINVRMPYGTFRYRVTNITSVLPSQVNVIIGHKGVQKLVLTACDPPFSAAKRLVITARLAGARSV